MSAKAAAGRRKNDLIEEEKLRSIEQPDRQKRRGGEKCIFAGYRERGKERLAVVPRARRFSVIGRRRLRS